MQVRACLTTLANTALVLGGLGLGVGCTSEPETEADRMIARMDALPEDQQVSGWANVRAMMMREAPKVGAIAPDFELETRHGTDTVRLSSFRGSVPVVLIFGSWT